MKSLLFSIHDRITEAFAPPFVASTVGEAQRMFASACADPQSQLNQHPHDFALYQLGSFNNSTGLLEPVVPPVFVRGASDLELVAKKLSEVNRAA